MQLTPFVLALSFAARVLAAGADDSIDLLEFSNPTKSSVTCKSKNKAGCNTMKRHACDSAKNNIKYENYYDTRVENDNEKLTNYPWSGVRAASVKGSDYGCGIFVEAASGKACNITGNQMWEAVKIIEEGDTEGNKCEKCGSVDLSDDCTVKIDFVNWSSRGNCYTC
ncbi:hypothetical protein N7492_007170 [Penicillium capsulatum]|uniref:Uncharacterized protein n=1 Tax=Penicillium capsulatum TaxID=69766 RepID=A0A9W9LLJ6_9EURO|nr:hypothetical protein N7492_007170 [Penicillium capsulatum]KAJ6117008.1 hypothetical protein N7512_006733 [Penicillium capsulatum]